MGHKIAFNDKLPEVLGVEDLISAKIDELKTEGQDPFTLTSLMTSPKTVPFRGQMAPETSREIGPDPRQP